MKTTILLAMVFVISASHLHAQISKGRVQIGGSVGFSHQDVPGGNYKVTSVDVSPSAGVFYKTNQLAGVIVSYDYNENSNSSSEVDRSYGLGIFFRQYKPVVKNLSFFFDERALYFYHYTNEQSGHSDYSSAAISVQPGLAYDITSKMQVEMSINNLLRAGYSNPNGVHSYYLSSSLESNLVNNVSLGFRFYLK